MAEPRDTFKYQFKVGNTIVHRGITDDFDRRAEEHAREWPDGHIMKVGNLTTREAALKWERDGGIS